jgi:hypothetical protein
MRFSGSRGHKNFDLDGGLFKGRAVIVRAAKDPVQVPQDETILAVIKRCLCRVELGEDCYIVIGLVGTKRTVPYGAPMSTWEEVCEELLEEAIKSDFV